MSEQIHDCLNILLSSDDNYAQHLCATIFSLLVHNTDFGEIVLYIVDNQIHDDSKEKITFVVGRFDNAKIIWIPFAEWESKLSLNMAWSISLSAYARLFVGEMLPRSIGRVLYLDCDMIIVDSLRSLWNTKLDSFVLGAVQDFISDCTKSAVGLLPKDAYFNSGLLLIDLNAWREQEISKKCIEFIDSRNGNVIHHDQGVINGVLKGKIHTLPIRYNLMTIHYIFNRRKLTKYFSDHASFYTETEVEEAKINPSILHYTPSFTSRPWVKGCRHPKKDLYWHAVAATPWNTTKPMKNRAKWYVKLIDWRYRNFPY